MSVFSKPRHRRESHLYLRLWILPLAIFLFSVFVFLEAANSQDPIRPFPDGPWERAPVQAQPQEPEKESFFQKLIPGSKKSSAGQTQFLPAPEPEPEPEPERNPVSIWVGNQFKREPKPAPAVEPEPAPAPKSQSPLSPLGWFRRDSKPAPEPEPEPASDSRSIFGWFKSEPAPAPGTVPDIRFEPMAGPAQATAATTSTPSGSRDFFGWLPGGNDSPSKPPQAEEAAPSSGGFFGFFKGDASKSEPVAAAAPEPEPKSDSGGFFGLFKDNASKSEPVAAAAPEPEPEPKSDSGGFFAFMNPWKSKDSRGDSAPEITIEADPEPDAASAGLMARLKRQPAAKPPPSSPPVFDERPVSDATVEAALAAKPEAGRNSGGFLAKILPGGGNPTPAEVSEPVAKPSAEHAPAVAATEPGNRTVHFESDIKPIFESKCISCHNRETLHGRVSLESRALAFADTPAGRVIIPGSPDTSLLFQNIVSARTTSNAMPPIGHSVSRKEKNLIYTWIKEGAYWPEGSSGQLVAY